VGSIDTLEEWKKFVANEPESYREIATVELYHPAFSSAYRFVSDYVGLVAALESGAPRNAGEYVQFAAAGFSVEEPGERQDAEQILTITSSAVDGVVNSLIDQITGSGYLNQLEIVYRKYYSADLSMPATNPLYLYASSINFDNENMFSIVAEDSDLATKRVGIIYTTELFPGLSQ